MNLIVTLYKEEDLNLYQKKGVNSVVLGTKDYCSDLNVVFSEEEIKRIAISASELGISVYVLINRMLFDEDMIDLDKYMNFLSTTMVSGIYFADMAVFMIAKKYNMINRLIYAPRAPLVNSNDASVYLELGVKMVELADEITLEDKLTIAGKLRDGVSAVIHGKLIMSGSKRKLLKNYMNEINKELVLENKHGLYLIEEHRNHKMPVFEDRFGTYIYQGEVFCSFDQIKELVDAGLTNIRIDGTLLSREHVIDVIDVYHELLNGNLDSKDVFINKYPETYDTGYYYKKTNLVK